MGNFARLAAASRADSNQSPRFPDGEGKRGQHRESPASHLAREGQTSAGPGTIRGPSGSKRVANRVRSWVASLALMGAFALCFLGPLWLVKAFAHVPGCRTKECDRRIHHMRRHHWRHTHPWTFAWHHLSRYERSWARCISSHESGNRQVARESGHLSFFQWELATWHAAGGSGNPETHPYDEQAVRAVRWAHRAGSSQWTTSSICGAA